MNSSFDEFGRRRRHRGPRRLTIVSRLSLHTLILRQLNIVNIFRFVPNRMTLHNLRRCLGILAVGLQRKFDVLEII